MSDNIITFLKFLNIKNVSENEFAQLLIVWEAVSFVDKMEWINKQLNK